VAISKKEDKAFSKGGHSHLVYQLTTHMHTQQNVYTHVHLETPFIITQSKTSEYHYFNPLEADVLRVRVPLFQKYEGSLS